MEKELKTLETRAHEYCGVLKNIDGSEGLRL